MDNYSAKLSNFLLIWANFPNNWSRFDSTYFLDKNLTQINLTGNKNRQTIMTKIRLIISKKEENETFYSHICS